MTEPRILIPRVKDATSPIGRITIAVDEETHRRLKDLSTTSGMTIGAIVAYTIKMTGVEPTDAKKK